MEQYEKFIEQEIETVIRFQGKSVDVLVHGEPERNDTVQYLGEQLDSYAITTNGWAQITVPDTSHRLSVTFPRTQKIGYQRYNSPSYRPGR
ncbi:hypothetical protein JCM33374_g5302 [Metschnikowia sp. JCM 33374]|nr:hypothetical protein JCM33374_g5302 [Metschnikowia sp. JCM 33374]